MREKIIYSLGILGTILLVYNFYNIFLVIPIDALQGAIYRIIFIHVPAAITAFSFYGVAVVASIAFLVRKNFWWDSLAVSAVEVGTMFTLVNLATGSIWGRVEWGIWWAWDARMTSQLMCFLLYLGYLLMRPAIAEPQQRGIMSAVLAIFAAADIPIVVMAIRLHNVRTQHPGPVLETGGLAPVYWPPFLIGIVCFLLLGSAMILVRLHQESSHREIDSLRRELHAI
ncbi:MAG TPA: cytochrome c biogenesis protein CcsA [Bryobacteraceae bacterium]|jgi:heme exporter protein C|nr:cytochrome c biogenesis protein CcsA [Bryobacteraceae bacterium]